MKRKNEMLTEYDFSNGVRGKYAEVQMVYQLKIQLQDVRPFVWRRILVKATATLAELAEVIICAVGWEGYHLHGFRIGTNHYQPKEEDDFGAFLDLNLLDESKFLLKDVLTEGGVFLFEYDFGDGWQHKITFEKIYSCRKLVIFVIN